MLPMNNIIEAITEERKKQILNRQYLPHDQHNFNDNTIMGLVLFSAQKSYNTENKYLRKDQLIFAAALIIAELQRIEYLECEHYCFVKYLP